MWLDGPPATRSRRPGRTERMREELCEALEEALVELEILPREEESALVGVYAVMDDLQRAIWRAEQVDKARYA